MLKYLSKTDFRVLTAVEMGQKNHELVPTQLIESIAKIRNENVHKVLSLLLKHKLIAHEKKQYDGYKLTYLGYDFLALKTFMNRNLIEAIGPRMGVGKESDIHVCQQPDGTFVILKLHRLGRISFRTVKNNRDYLQGRKHGSWQYIARLAALKEFAYMRALKERDFPVPTPIDVNRHCILMSKVEARPFLAVHDLINPHNVIETLMHLIVRLAQAGLIHGDFNEFNLLVNDKDEVTLIDFPQMVAVTHPNASYYFDRDVKCIKDLFRKRWDIDVVEAPTLEDALDDAAEDDDETGQAARDALSILKAGGVNLKDAQKLVVPSMDDDAFWASQARSQKKVDDSDGSDDDEDDYDEEDEYDEDDEEEGDANDNEDESETNNADASAWIKRRQDGDTSDTITTEIAK